MSRRPITFLSLRFSDFRSVTQKCGENRSTKIDYIFSAGYTEIVDRLIRCGALLDKPDIKMRTALSVAVKRRHSACMHSLLNAGADPNGDAGCLTTPLYEAAMDGYLDGVKVSDL